MIPLLNEERRTSHRTFLVLALIAFFLLLTVSTVVLTRFVGDREAVSERTAEITQAEIEKEFYALEPFPDSSKKQVNSFHKKQHGVVNEYYETNASFDDIESYYNSQLVKLGWKFKGKTKVTSWGKDEGESITFFCKKKLSAELYYTGRRRETVGFVYSFGLSWGLYDCR